MTTLARITIALILALFLSSCGFDTNIGDFSTGVKGNGIVAKDSRQITTEFSEISASEGLQVYVTQAEDFEITVEADENVIDLIGTDIENNKLKIHTLKNIGRATKKIYVSLPEITSLKGSSGSHLTTSNTITSDNMEVDASSGAMVNIALMANEIDIDASSGGNLKVSGSAAKADIDVSSGGNIDGKNLETKICHADANSGGNLSVSVSQSLVADANSGGNIAYLGNPEVQKKKSVSGSIHKY